jgi:CHAT domain-containing protein
VKNRVEASLTPLLAKVSALSDERSRRQYAAANPGVVRGTFVEQLTESVRRHVRVDLKQSLSLAEAAIVFAEELREDKAVALALRAKANVLWFKGQYKHAVKLFDRAVAILEKIADLTELGRTLSTSIQPLALLGDYERALVHAERARAIFTQTRDTLRLARLEINLANVLHRREHPLEALECYDRAYKQLLPHKDREGIGVALHNMAVCLISLNDFHRALHTYQDARKFCYQHEMPLLVAQADYNIAYLYYLRGDYTRALDLLQKARNRCRDNGDAYHEALCNLDQSEIYLELNLVDEAEELARQGSVQFERLGLGYEQMRAVTNVAIAMSRKGRASAALKLFAQARNKAAAERNAVWPRVLDLYKALVMCGQGELARSHRLATNALEFFSSYPLPRKAAVCHLLLARLAFQTSTLDTAYLHVCNARDLLKGLDVPILNYQTHMVMGRVQEIRGNLDAAQTSYEAARIELQTILSSLQGEELKISFMQNRQDVYERLIRLRLAANSGVAETERTFTYVEEAKSRSLRDLIFGRLRPYASSDSKANQYDRRVRKLREELSWYYHRIEQEQLSRDVVGTNKIQELQNQAQIREKELQRVFLEIHSSNVSDSRLRISTVVPLAEIREGLDEDAVILEFFPAGDGLLAAAVLTTKTLEIFRLGRLSDIGHLLHMLRFQLSRVRLHKARPALFQKTLVKAIQARLHQLYTAIVAPLRDRIQGCNLTIVPHGILHHLPFHALFDGERYLIDDFNVSYAPSASIYALLNTRRLNRSGRCLILGIPDAQAPRILDEVQAVAAAVSDPEVHLGVQATLEVLEQRGPLSRSIHIATHGYFRQDNPLFSSVRLGDCYLNVYDLYNLELPVDLLTLSGCGTGLNAVTAGDELLGLARGLLYAGAQSLLLTLWDVDDDSTAMLMTFYYDLITRRSGKAQALRDAMLKLRETRAHPYYWAPFILIGRHL